MEKELVNQLKAQIENYSDPNKDYETGFVQGVFYALNCIQHGKAYADERLRVHSDGRKFSDGYICGCEEGKECGC